MAAERAEIIEMWLVDRTTMARLWREVRRKGYRTIWGIPVYYCVNHGRIVTFPKLAPE